jgi:hypothetical protein
MLPFVADAHSRESLAGCKVSRGQVSIEYTAVSRQSLDRVNANQAPHYVTLPLTRVSSLFYNDHVLRANASYQRISMMIELLQCRVLSPDKQYSPSTEIRAERMRVVCILVSFLHICQARRRRQTSVVMMTHKTRKTRGTTGNSRKQPP